MSRTLTRLLRDARTRPARGGRFAFLGFLGCALAGVVGSQDAPGRAQVEDPARRYDGKDPASVAALRRTRGVWPIANGRIFAYVGLGDPANRLFMITGPHYQTQGNHNPQGAFGEQWIEVRAGGEVLRPTRQGWRRPAGAGAAAITTEEFADGLSMTVTDVALADAAAIVRRVVLRGVGARELEVVFRFSNRPGACEVDGAILRKSYRRGEQTYRLAAVPLPSGRSTFSPRPDGALVARVRAPRQSPEGSVEVAVALVTSLAADEERATLSRLRRDGATVAQRQGLRAWRDQLEDTIAADPPGPIAATLESVKVLVLAQRALPQGAVAPMVNFKGVWLRDSNGPLKTLLWMGKFHEARALLRYYRGAAALHRSTHREFPLDLPVDRAPELSAEEWAATGTDRCEVPSFVVLQHQWYHDATGDRELIAEHYPYLRRNALHQVRVAGPHGPLQPFNGDETYLHGAFYSLFPGRGVWPNQFPSAQAFSLDSALTYVACQRAMVDLCAVAGHPEHAAEYRRLGEEMAASIEAHFWLDDAGHWAPAVARVGFVAHTAPYAPVNLAPLWLGTHDASDPHAVQNLQAVIALLGRADGLCRMTPSVGHVIGSLPGYYLANLAAVDHPLAWRCLPAVLRSCSPSGEWVEVHEPDGPGHGYGDGTYANRLRPWESGLNLDAVLRFLTGARFRAGTGIDLRPRLPEGLALERLGPLRVGDTRLSLRYPRQFSAPVEVVHEAGPGCIVNGATLAPGGRVQVPLTRAAELEVPAPRDYSGALPPPAPGVSRLVVTVRPDALGENTYALDAGLPFSPGDLAALLFAGGARAFDEVVLDPSALAVDRHTMKPERFWRDPDLVAALRRFQEAGGRIVR